ncbi:MAG: hypothetical protein LBQ30_09105, partial [Treponema sp.]|nr:hypothetical protein [Treponema sp.]
MLPYENRIGTERESSLHRSLKCHYTGEGGVTEVVAPQGTYICDGITETGEIIEVQTGSFKPLQEKAQCLARLNPLRIIHPIIIYKHLERYDAQQRLCSCRKSPRKGTIWDLFKALVYAPEMPLIPRVTIELALVGVTERRIQDGRGSWRRKGISIVDTELTELHDSIVLSGKDAYEVFLPVPEGKPFTARDLGTAAGITPSLARKTLYVLTRLGVAQRLIAKKGNALVYMGPHPRPAPRKKGGGSRSLGLLTIGHS